MNLTPYLLFDGHCEEAFTLYARVLGAPAAEFSRFAQTPMAGQVGPDWAQKIIHADLKIGNQILMGSDAPPAHYKPPQGISICINFDSEAEAERVYKALSESGKIVMALQETFWAKRYGQIVDRFGIPWMFNVPKAM